jgi:hypothetical protein
MKILRQRQQAEAIGCSRWTVRRIAKTDPAYPPEVEVTPGIRGVIEDDFIKWLKAKPLRTPERFQQSAEQHDAHVRAYEQHKAKARK